MWKRNLFFAALISACVAALPVDRAKAENPAVETEHTQVPPALSAYVSEGQFDPGDFAWARGYFADDSAAGKFTYASISNWLDSCSQNEVTRVQAALSEMDYPNVDMARLSVSTDYCAQFRVLPSAESYPTFEAFLEARERIAPVVVTLSETMALVDRVGRPDNENIADQLRHRRIADQVFRSALSWSKEGAEPSRRAPVINAADEPAFHAYLWSELDKIDRDNTRWLKQVVARSGWPTVSLVGEDASWLAWLLVQHADHDPVFQLQVLRLMEPLVAEKEVSPRNYAYLYDRVMLKLTGKQRFATQMWCEKGKFVPQPLEDAALVDQLRAGMQLEPLAEYQANFGAC